MNQTNELRTILFKADRKDPSLIEIWWSENWNPNQIVVNKGESPNQFDMKSPLETKPGHRCVIIKESAINKRPYYLVKLPDQDGTVVSERRLSMESTVNFRDLGGYPNHESRLFNWGLSSRYIAPAYYQWSNATWSNKNQVGVRPAFGGWSGKSTG